MKRPGTSVAAVVIAALVGVVTVSMAALGAANHAAERERGWKALRTDLARRSDQLAVALTLPVWNIDRAQIDRGLDSLAADEAMYAVEVQAAGRRHRRVRDERWQLATSDAPLSEPGLLVETRPISFSGETIGTMTVYATPRWLRAHLATQLWTLVGFIGAVDALLVLGLYLALWRIVLRPLRSLEQYALSVTQGGGVDGAAVGATPFTGELETLRASITSMIQSMRASERNYREMVDFAPIGIYGARVDGTVVSANAAFARMLGHDDAPSVLGLNMATDVFADPALRASLIEQHLATGFTPATEGQFKRRDGGTLWVEGTARLVKDDAGEIAHVETFVRDISQRKRAQDEVRASEERYRLLFEGNPIPMLVYDTETLRFLAVNAAAVRQYDYSREELLAMAVPDLAVPGDPNLDAFLAARFDARPDLVHVGERQQRRRDGTILDMDLTSLLVVFDGRPARMTLARDVTVERRATAEKARLEESLRRSETMSAMGALVAGVAHEVRNPLFSISASVDAMDSEFGQRPDYAEYGARLRSQVARLTQLMRDLLDYGKPPVPRVARALPGDLARRSLRACQPLARAHDVALAADAPDTLPALQLDASRMEQVLENLLTNAIQHSPPGGTVRLNARLDPADAALMLFEVEDDGPGIAAADLPHLFEPFFSRRKGGTGLGLSILQRIVDAHGGRVSARNGASGGAVFTVALPVTGEPS
jgi:PAS domain S-box-containing protein